MLRCGQNKVSFFPGGRARRCGRPWRSEPRGLPAAPSTHRYPPSREVTVKRIAEEESGGPRASLTAPLGHEAACSPYPEKGAGQACPGPVVLPDGSIPHAATGSRAQDPDGRFPANPGIHHGVIRPCGCRKGYSSYRATPDWTLSGGVMWLHPVSEEIRAALNIVGPDRPPIFTKASVI